MKIFNIIECLNSTDYLEKFCDIWIDPTGKIHGLSSDLCHLSYIKENFNSDIYSIDLINDNWIKITNCKHTLIFESLKKSFNKNKKLISKIILEKDSIDYILKIDFVDSGKYIFEMPKDKQKLLIL